MRIKPLKLKPNGLGVIDAELSGFAWEPPSRIDAVYRLITNEPRAVHMSDRYPIYPQHLGSVNGIVSYCRRNVFSSMYGEKLRFIWIRDSEGIYWISEEESAVNYEQLEKIMRKYGRSTLADFMVRGKHVGSFATQHDV